MEGKKILASGTRYSGWMMLALLLLCPAMGSAAIISDLSELRMFDFLENTEMHGFRMDDQYRLFVEQIADVAIIQLRKQERPPGGPFLFYDPKTGEDESIIRYEDRIDLLRIRAEVLIPAPPNYVKNPGQRYRITINGITAAPNYNRVFEVNAGDALNALFEEINNIYNRTDGIYRDAIFYGAVIAMRVLNQTGHLPAELSLGTAKTKSFQTRIQGEYLTRRDQPRIERFPWLAGTPAYASVFMPDPEAILNNPLPDAARRTGAAPATVGMPSGRAANPYRSQHSMQRPSAMQHRQNQTRSIQEQKDEQNPLGRQGKPLTVPEHDYPAISASQIQNLDLLLGEGASGTPGNR